jgi:hypothetical protein
MERLSISKHEVLKSGRNGFVPLKTPFLDMPTE